MEEVKCFIVLMRSQSFNEPVALDCELHKCFSVFFICLLAFSAWVEGDG